MVGRPSPPSEPSGNRRGSQRRALTATQRASPASNLPFIFFVGFLTLTYIYNVHYCEKKARQIIKLSDEIKDLKFEYQQLNAELMNQYKLSELSKDVAGVGLKLDADGMYKLTEE